MKTFKSIYIYGIVGILLSSCSDFLELNPKGTLADEQLDAPEYVEKKVIAAYALVENDNVQILPWLFSDLRSGDAYKGGAVAPVIWPLPIVSKWPTPCG